MNNLKLVDEWESPYSMQFAFVEAMRTHSEKGEDATEINMTELPVGTEIVVNGQG